MQEEPDPHKGRPLIQAGTALSDAQVAVIMLHGRGAGAQDIIGLAEIIDLEGIAYLAPEAAGNSWYPLSFMAPLESNAAGVDSALRLIADIIGMAIVNDVTPERIAILGFSQGACLALEFAARHPDRYAGIIALSGGLIGETIDESRYRPTLEETPVFLGCSDIDPFIPLERVQESSVVMRKLGGSVTERIYPNMAHTVNDDEVRHIRTILARALADDSTV